MRAETGTMQFGDKDWRGVFIRGDNAFAFRLAIETILKKTTAMKQKDTDVVLAYSQLTGLLELLKQSDERIKLTKDNIHQKLKPFDECTIQQLN